MAVISVEVPEKIAKKFNPYVVVSSYELYEEFENNSIVDFGKGGVGKEEFRKYLSSK